MRKLFSLLRALLLYAISSRILIIYIDHINQFITQLVTRIDVFVLLFSLISHILIVLNFLFFFENWLNFTNLLRNLLLLLILRALNRFNIVADLRLWHVIAQISMKLRSAGKVSFVLGCNQISFHLILLF